MDVLEGTGEGQGEEAHAGVKVEGEFAFQVAGGEGGERFEQEAVDLEEAFAADAEALEADGVIEFARDKAWDLFGAPFEEPLGERFVGGGDVDLDFGFVGKDFGRVEEAGEARLFGHVREDGDHLVDFGRGDGAGAGVDLTVRAGGEKADAAFVEVELDAVAVVEWVGGQGLDVGVEADAADALQGLAQDLDFLGELLFGR